MRLPNASDRSIFGTGRFFHFFFLVELSLNVKVVYIHILRRKIISRPQTNGRNTVHFRAAEIQQRIRMFDDFGFTHRFRFVLFISLFFQSRILQLSAIRPAHGLPATNNDNLKSCRQLIRAIKSIMCCLANIFCLFGFHLNWAALRNGNVEDKNEIPLKIRI